jgi:hypothetical protein
MNDGVALLLERMKTNPEEFIGTNGFAYSKWGSLIGAYTEHLEPEDQKALTKGLNALLQQTFTEKVMEELVEPKTLTIANITKQYHDSRLTPAWSGGAVSGTITLNTPIAGVTQTA